MKTKLWHFCIRTQNVLSSDNGQDLIEYALIIALIALGATAGMQTVASDINNAFGTIGNQLTSTLA